MPADALKGPDISRRHRSGLSACLGLAGLLLAVASMGLAPSASFAEDQTWGYALAHELMSPYCPGRTLSACTSDQAAELRQWILLQEAAGASQEEVMGVLEQRFGDVIRSSPEAEGWGLAAWLLPGAVLLVGALAVVGVLRRMVAKPEHPIPPVSSQGSPSPSSGPVAGGASEGPDDEIARLVDQEIAAGER